MIVLNEFLLCGDKNLNRITQIKLPDGSFLQLDPDLEEFELAPQFAAIGFVPSKISDEYTNNTPLKVGDAVICHFHVIRTVNEVTVEGKQYFRCNFHHLWAKIENEIIIPLEEFLFIEPILEDKENMFVGRLQIKPEQENVHKRGRVSAIGVMAEQAGIKLNDTVIVTQNAECEIEIFGKIFWRLRIRNVVGIEREGNLICMTGKVLVKEIEEEEKQGLLAGVIDEKKERKGLVILTDIEEISQGDTVSYHNGIDTKFIHNEELYAYIDTENINYVQQPIWISPEWATDGVSTVLSTMPATTYNNRPSGK